MDKPHCFPPRAPPTHGSIVTTTKTSLAHSCTSPTPAGRAQPAPANPRKNKHTKTIPSLPARRTPGHPTFSPKLPPLPSTPPQRPHSQPPQFNPVQNTAATLEAAQLLGKFNNNTLPIPLPNPTTAPNATPTIATPMAHSFLGPVANVTPLYTPGSTSAPGRTLQSLPGTTPNEYITVVSHIWEQPSPTMASPTFHFQWSAQAAAHNWDILAQHKFSLSSTLLNQQGTPLGFGSEFRHPTLLDPLLDYHPLWRRTRQTLISGVVFPLTPLPEDKRTTETSLVLRRGNHQAVKAHSAAVQTLLRKEVLQGWQLPLPRHRILHLPGVLLAPLGLVTQATINSRGEITPKHRLTHDQSFEIQPGVSVNSRLLPDQLTPCRYGTALRRFLHFIVDLRRRHPATRILLTKLDFKAAYRRLHMAPETAIQSAVVFDDFALVALRLTFGGAPCPSHWSDLSEIACDTCNKLARCPAWNPRQHPQLRSPHQDRFVGPPRFLPPNIPCAPAQPTIVDVLSDDSPFTECYLDDLFTCFLDNPLTLWQGASITLLVLHLLGRPLAAHEPLPRDDLLSFEKTLAEGTPSETKTILGWELDTRSLLLRLSSDKHTLWQSDIQRLLHQPTLTYDDLATLVGRLNHAAYVVPTARAFLCHIRRAEQHALKKGRSPVTLDTLQLAELQQWHFFLDRARAGLSLNLLTLRTPTIALRADACEHGIGGYSLSSGIAWRWPLPEQFWGYLTLNLLEYIASAVAIAVEIWAHPPNKLSCILSQLDSTTADYWLLRGGSRFHRVERAIHLQVSRWLSTLLLQHELCTYSQWIPGEENIIADSLSRDHHLSDNQLTHLLLTLAPQQLPPNFQLFPLPAELSSKLTLWLQQGCVPRDYSLTPTRSTLARSGFGSNSSPLSGLMVTTPSSTPSNPPNAFASWAPLPTPCVKHTSLATETLRWQHRQSEIPSLLYRRPLPPTTAQTHSSLFTEKLTVFYTSNSTATEETTPASNINEHYQPSFS